MARPVTLFTGQWADLALEELAAKCAEWGFDGLELACWGDHFDVAEALRDSAYCAASADMLESHGLQLLGDQQPPRRPGGVRPDRRAAPRRSCRPRSGATATPRGCASAPPSG